MGLPLVVALNCIDDCRAEAEALEGVAVVEHVGLAQVAEGKIEAAVAVLVQSLAYLPRAAQRRLQPWQLILSLGCADKAVDSGLANDLGLQLLHVDSGRSEEVADTAMALILGLLRRTPALAAQAGASAGWLGALPAACRGMRRCRGQVLGIIGTSPSACALATRCLAFKMKVLYVDVEEERDGDRRHRRVFSPMARKVDSVKELLSLSDVISLHCPLTNETLQLINAETIKYCKSGALLVNTSSSHLLDDCALKEALIDGKLAGCALDGVEGPQWLEAWVREMPNVLILPRSADYSEEVWAEIRAKAVSVLRSFLLEGVVPASAASDDDDSVRDCLWQEDRVEKIDKDSSTRVKDGEQRTGESQTAQDFRQKQMYFQSQDLRIPSQEVDLSDGLVQRDARSNNVKGTGKKGKKKAGRRKAQQQSNGALSATERDSTWPTLLREERRPNGTSVDAVVNSNSRFGSPEETKIKRETDGSLVVESIVESSQVLQKVYVKGTSQVAALDYLKEGQIIALRTRADSGYYVARQKGPGRGWRLDTLVDVTCRDPAAQFLVVVRHRVDLYPDSIQAHPMDVLLQLLGANVENVFHPSDDHPAIFLQDRIGLRSLAAGGKLLQANKKLELVFVNHTFDVWESWIVEGGNLDNCTLTNSKFRGVILDVAIEILAAVGEEDGVVRWLS